jgi:protein TonB
MAIPLWEAEDDSLPEPAQLREGAFVSPESVPPPPPPPPAAPVRIGGAIPEPRKTRHVNPVYPQVAIEARVQGTVVLECTIGADGKVHRVDKLKGPALVTEAAIEAVKQWEYTPTLIAGVPTPVIMTVTVNFTLR